MLPSAGTVLPGDPADNAAPICRKHSHKGANLQIPELNSTLAFSQQRTSLQSPPGDWPHGGAKQPSLTNAKQPSCLINPCSLMLTSSTLLHSQGLPPSESSTSLQAVSTPPSSDSHCSSSLPCPAEKKQVLNILYTSQSSDPGRSETLNLLCSVPDVGTMHVGFCCASANLFLDQRDAHRQLRMHHETPLLSSGGNVVCSEMSKHTTMLRDPRLQPNLLLATSQAASPGQHVSLPHHTQPLSTQVWLVLDRLVVGSHACCTAAFGCLLLHSSSSSSVRVTSGAKTMHYHVSCYHCTYICMMCAS